MWERDETKLFLKICVDENIMKQMDKKTLRHSEIFKSIIIKLNKHGYNKTARQGQVKFKTLKSKYYLEKKN